MLEAVADVICFVVDIPTRQVRWNNWRNSGRCGGCTGFGGRPGALCLFDLAFYFGRQTESLWAGRDSVHYGLLYVSNCLSGPRTKGVEWLIFTYYNSAASINFQLEVLVVLAQQLVSKIMVAKLGAATVINRMDSTSMIDNKVTTNSWCSCFWRGLACIFALRLDRVECKSELHSILVVSTKSLIYTQSCGTPRIRIYFLPTANKNVGRLNR